MTSMIEAQEKGAALADRIVRAIMRARSAHARTAMGRARVLGMSDLGGCREYMRATIAGEPKAPETQIKWAAEVGTAVGDYVEKILHEHDSFDVQETVLLTLPRTKIQVTGHLDEVDVVQDLIADNKTVDGLSDVMQKGPSFKNKVQIAGYLMAAVDAKRLTENATGHLVYFDRSGKDATPYVWSTTLEQAKLIIDAAEDRLLDVTHALATQTRNGRDGKLMTDEPESWCFNVQCPFYDACWAGYTPTGKIEHPREIDAVQRRLNALAEIKDASTRSDTAKVDLRGVEGVVGDGPLRGTIVQWTLRELESGRIAETLNVRPPKK